MIEIESIVKKASHVKGLLGTHVSIYSPDHRMTSAFDYFIVGKTLITDIDTNAVVGWISSNKLAQEMVVAHNEKLIRQAEEQSKRNSVVKE